MLTATLSVPASKTTDEIDSSITKAVEEADRTQFSSFDYFADFSVTVEEIDEATETQEATLDTRADYTSNNSPDQTSTEASTTPSYGIET